MYFDRSSHCWLVTGYAPIVAILGDPRFSSDLGLGAPPPAQARAAPSLHAAVTKQMIFMDGEHHRQAQDVLLRPLAQMVKKTPATIRALLSTILATAQAKGELDLVRDFASPISLYVIAEVLGIPTDDHKQLLQLEQWSNTFGDITSGHLRGDIQDVNRLVSYFRSLIAEKRRDPGDDLLSALIQAKNLFPEDDDLIANCMMVFVAGRATTQKLFGNGIPLLFPIWHQLGTTFREQPALPRLVGEELLRMVTPTRYVMRQASEDIDLSEQFPGNHLIRRGHKVFLFLEAANRDPASFNDPDSFDPQRQPNKHIAFGFGPHRCPGAALARLEIQIGLEMLLSLPDLRPKPGTAPVWDTNPNLGGYTAYPAVIGKA
jgi:cytochrome P450